jgi:hypothetical protein
MPYLPGGLVGDVPLVAWVRGECLAKLRQPSHALQPVAQLRNQLVQPAADGWFLHGAGHPFETDDVGGAVGEDIPPEPPAQGGGPGDSEWRAARWPAPNSWPLGAVIEGPPDACRHLSGHGHADGHEETQDDDQWQQAVHGGEDEGQRYCPGEGPERG